MSEVGQNAKVTLRRINAETVRAVCSLSVSDSQRKFVAPNAVSIAQAYFCKNAWFRAIYAGENPVGFVMLYKAPKRGKYYLWRFMIDSKYQCKGFGHKALELIINHVKKMPKAKALTLFVVRGEGSAENLYLKFGFKFTGKIEHGEHFMKLEL